MIVKLFVWEENCHSFLFFSQFNFRSLEGMTDSSSNRVIELLYDWCEKVALRCMRWVKKMDWINFWFYIDVSNYKSCTSPSAWQQGNGHHKSIWINHFCKELILSKEMIECNAEWHREKLDLLKCHGCLFNFDSWMWEELFINFRKSYIANSSTISSSDLSGSFLFDSNWFPKFVRNTIWLSRH